MSGHPRKFDGYWTPTGVPVELGGVRVWRGESLSCSEYRDRLAIRIHNLGVDYRGESLAEVLCGYFVGRGLLPEIGWNSPEDLSLLELAELVSQSDLASICFLGEQDWPATVQDLVPLDALDHVSLEEWASHLGARFVHLHPGSDDCHVDEGFWGARRTSQGSSGEQIDRTPKGRGIKDLTDEEIDRLIDDEIERAYAPPPSEAQGAVPEPLPPKRSKALDDIADLF